MIKRYYYSIKNENNKIWVYIYIGPPKEYIKDLKEISNKEIFLENFFVESMMVLFTNNMMKEKFIIILENCIIEQYQNFRYYLPTNISINYDNCAFMYKGKI